MRTNEEPTEKPESIEDIINQAIELDQAPPKEFVLAVLSGEIELSDETTDRLIAKGWVPRQRCEIWSRVMGYLRPVSSWNKGKKSEYAERKPIDASPIYE